MRYLKNDFLRCLNKWLKLLKRTISRCFSITNYKFIKKKQKLRFPKKKSLVFVKNAKKSAADFILAHILNIFIIIHINMLNENATVSITWYTNFLITKMNVIIILIFINRWLYFKLFKHEKYFSYLRFVYLLSKIFYPFLYFESVWISMILNFNFEIRRFIRS